MTLLSNSAEGYSTTGTTVTTGNSGGSSGDAFTLVTATVASTIQAINTDHAHGSWCYQIVETNAANNSIVGWVGLSATSITRRYYIKFNTLPSAGAGRLRIFALRNTSGSNIVTLDVGTNNKWFLSIAGVNQATGWTGAVTTGQWYRVEVESQTGATGTGDGYVAAGYYLLDSTSPVETRYVNSAASTGTAAFSEVRVGKLDASGYADFKFDDMAVQTGSVTPLGPFSASSVSVSAPPATATSAGNGGAADAETLVTGGGPARASSAANGGAVSPDISASGVRATATSRAYAGGSGTAALLTATADPTNSPPRVILAVAAAQGTTVTVQRVDAQGNNSTVRSANPGTLASGSWVGFDYEAPYGQPLTYTATTDVSAAQGLSASVTLTVTQPWLVHPGIPSLSVPLEITDMPAPTRPTARGVYTVLGRTEAVVRSDGRRKARTFDLTVRTYTAQAEDDLNTLLDDDSVLLLQITDPRIYRPMYAWVSIGDMGGAPLATYAEGFYTWTLPCVEAARPSGLLQSQRTWPDVVASEPSWSTTLGDYASWRDLITNTTVSA